MKRRRARESNLTERFLAGELEEDAELHEPQRFGSRSRDAVAGKMLRTALLRAQERSDIDIDSLPIGRVNQVFSLFCEVESDGRVWLCVTRKTMAALADSAILPGDRVRFRDLGLVDEQGRPQAVIEQRLPRDTVLTRADSFKGIEQHPIVANAQQMLIVAAVREPPVRWGLIDRMLVAARGGGLEPIICLNKIDLDDAPAESEIVLAHYRSIGVTTLRTSVPAREGLETLRELLHNRVTALAGHSGVGKSTLINAIEPGLNLRTADISGYTGKGRHTTTTARLCPLRDGGIVVDTPGVKLFGLWGVTRENLPEFFPDITDGTAPDWRRESFERIAASLPS